MDQVLVHELVRTADDLRPAVPAGLSAMERWLEQVRDLERRLPEYREELAHGDLAPELHAGLRDLVAEHRGPLAERRRQVEQWLVQARTLEQRTVADQREAWDEVARSVAGLEVYGGLELAPQLGLVPLQLNPRSGLWEFWVADTGSEPRIADPARGRLEVDGDTAIVLVLLPGGVLEPGGAGEHAPVVVPPMFMGRFEVTQGQYLRAMGENPSRNRHEIHPEMGPSHPVDLLTWFDAAECARRLGLELPGELEWEFAARALEDPPTLYGGGDSPLVLRGRENLMNYFVEEQARAEKVDASWHEEYATSAPVGLFRPNPFGLHDMLGNVCEWTADLHDPDPTVASEDRCSFFRMVRGGSGQQWLEVSRIGYRLLKDLPEASSQDRGFRLARRIDP
jgi:formylglycine-generating enzyme required for sulfatase activity